MKNYDDLSKKELIQRLEDMKEVIRQMEKYNNDTELLSFPWIGNLGQWNWIIESNQLFFNEKKATNLGYTSEEIPENTGFEYFTSMLHPDDYEDVMDNMRCHLKDLCNAYEVEYRIKNKKGDYVWYYDRGKITKRNENGEPAVVSGIVFDISKNKELESNLKRSNKKLHELTITDELTLTFNRRFMTQKIHDEIELYKRTKIPFSLIMLDIDNFKKVNDNFGHDIGDTVLKKVAEVIKNQIRSTDFLSRWGGDELMILLSHTDKTNAVKVAENIREALSSSLIEKVGTVTVSIGVSEYNTNYNSEDLIKNVDNLLYQAKSKGRIRVSY